MLVLEPVARVHELPGVELEELAEEGGLARGRRSPPGLRCGRARRRAAGRPGRRRAACPLPSRRGTCRRCPSGLSTARYRRFERSRYASTSFSVRMVAPRVDAPIPQLNVLRARRQAYLEGYPPPMPSPAPPRRPQRLAALLPVVAAALCAVLAAQMVGHDSRFLPPLLAFASAALPAGGRSDGGGCGDS